MKALSLKQPHAELIVSGKKTIEIRTWNTKFRGRFLIHASKTLLLEDCKEFGIDCSKLVKGAIIGSAELVDVKRYETLEEFRKDFDKHLAADRWFRKGCCEFILRSAKRIKPFKFKGSLGFFEVEWPTNK